MSAFLLLSSPLLSSPQAVLDESGLTADQLSSVEIVGGASRMPCVKREIATLLQLDTSKHNFGLMCTVRSSQ